MRERSTKRARAARRLAAVAVAACVTACSADHAPTGSDACANATQGLGTRTLALQRVAAALEHPVDFATLPGTPQTWLVAEQSGVVQILDRGVPRSEPFLDLTAAVTRNPDSGLLGVALHPRFPRDPRIYVRYSIDSPLQTVLDEFRSLPGDPTRVDPTSGKRLVAIGRDSLGHDGGSVLFGPDGSLYVTVGDGGPLRDPKGKAQDLGKLSGKILRLDVDHGEPYRIPTDNPFVDVPTARAEIFAYGLRNPWRASFDSGSGDLWIADVGEDTREEIDRVAAGTPGGENFGWSRFEGTHCFDMNGGCDPAGLTPPVLEYEHVEPGGGPPGGPCAVVGGSVYRGCAVPELRGSYFYGDFCAGFVRSFRLIDGQVSDERDRTAAFRAAGLDSVSAFGTDADGELYVLDYVDGDVFRIVAADG